MAKCVVFGGSGFIGSHLVAELLSRGHSVTSFGRGAAPVETPANFRFATGDFLDQAAIEAAVEGAEYVFHLISLTTPATSEANPYIDIETNVRMSLALFDACAKFGVKRLVFASSGGSIYGDTEREMHAETDVTAPVSPYAIGKNAIENYLRYYRAKYGLESVTLRISNVFGEGQRSKNGQHGIVPTFLGALRDGQELRVYGDGAMVRDYIYVKDLVACIASIFDAPDLKYDIYNCGSGVGISILEVVEVLEGVAGISAVLRFAPAPSSFVQHVVLDCSRLESEHGKFAVTPFREGVANVWLDMRDAP